jgi:hypothetical protein
VEIRKIIQRRIRHSAEGVEVVGDVNAVIAANLGGPSDQPWSRHDDSGKDNRAKEERDAAGGGERPHS